MKDFHGHIGPHFGEVERKVLGPFHGPIRQRYRTQFDRRQDRCVLRLSRRIEVRSAFPDPIWKELSLQRILYPVRKVSHLLTAGSFVAEVGSMPSGSNGPSHLHK